MFKNSVRFKLSHTLGCAGQAVFEYVLMLIVTLSLIVGLSIHFIQPLGDYLKNYAGAYIECLLETAELPFILASTPSNECDIENLRTTVSEISSEGGGSGGSSGDNSGSNNSANNDSNERSNTAGNTGGQNGNRRSPSGGGGNSGPRNNSGGGISETGVSANTGSSEGSGDSRGSRLAAKARQASAGEGGSGSTTTVPYKYEQDMGRGLTGVIPVERTKDEQILQAGRNPSDPPKAPRDNQVDQLRKKGFTAEIPPPAKVAGQESDGITMDLNLGKYLRYLMIGGIVLALVVMVFLQLNSLRKGWTD